MVYYKTKEEIELIRLSSLLVAKTHAELAKLIKPGITSKKLDQRAEEFIRDNGGVPAFKGYRGFPFTLCVSPEDQVVHGMPNNDEVQEGMILSVDCGVLMNGFYGDSAYTFAVGEISDENIQRMVDAMKAFSLLMKVHKVEKYKACATSAMREAYNGTDIVSLIKKKTDIKIDIIDPNNCVIETLKHHWGRS